MIGRDCHLVELFWPYIAGRLQVTVERSLDWTIVEVTLGPDSQRHGHPRSSLGATLGVRMSATAYRNHSTVSSVWPIGTSRLNLRLNK